MNDQLQPETTDSTPVAQADGRWSAYIEILFGAGRGRRKVLQEDETVLGRSPDCQFILEDPTVSRQHAVVLRTGGGWRLSDRHSHNGIRMLGKKVQEGALEDGTTFELGATVLVLRYGSNVVSSDPVRNTDVSRTQPMPIVRSMPRDLSRTPPVDTPILPDVLDTLPPQQPSRPRRKPVAILVQLTTYLVLATLCLGGGLVTVKLMNSISLTGYSRPSGEKVSYRRPTRSQRIRLTELTAETDETVVGESPVEEAPDVAMQDFETALETELQGDFEGAIELLVGISKQYPEFVPPSGIPLQEHIDTLRRYQAYKVAIQSAKQVWDSRTTSQEELAAALESLAGIPTDQVEFHGEASALAASIQRRLRLLREGLLEEDQPPAMAPDAKEGPSEVDVTVDPSTGESEARALYRKGQFRHAGERMQLAADHSADPKEKERRQELADTLRGLDRAVAEARRREEEGPTGMKAAADAWSRAVAFDRDVSGDHVAGFRRSLVAALVVQARRGLETGDYALASSSLAEARRLASGNDEVKRLSAALAHRALELVRRSRALAFVDGAEARRVLGDAEALGGHLDAVAREIEAVRVLLVESPSEMAIPVRGQ